MTMSGVGGDIIKGMYQLTPGPVNAPTAKVRLLGAGSILCEVIAAAELLAEDWHVESEIWSVTSFSELARNARETERWNRLHPLETQRKSHVQQCLRGTTPVLAASDYVRALPQLIASHVEAPY